MLVPEKVGGHRQDQRRPLGGAQSPLPQLIQKRLRSRPIAPQAVSHVSTHLIVVQQQRGICRQQGLEGLIAGGAGSQHNRTVCMRLQQPPQLSQQSILGSRWMPVRHLVQAVQQ